MVVRLVRSEAYGVPVPPAKTALATKLLAGTGALALTAGAAAFLVSPLLLKAPLAKHSVLKATGPATFLDTKTGEPLKGTFVQDSTISTHRLNGIDAGTSTVASYDQTQTTSFVSATLTKQLATATVTYAFDRSTGVGRPGAQGDTLATTAHLLKLPFGTQQRDYTIWDDTAKRAVPLVFVRETTLSGLRVYEFSRPVTPTDLGPVPLFEAIPGSWVGHPEIPSIPAHEWYESTDSTLYVEPTTGSLVGGASSPHVWARTTGPLGGLTLDLLTVDHATPVAKDAARLVADARAARDKVVTLQRAPRVLGGVALICFLLTLLLHRVRRAETLRPELFLPQQRAPLSDTATERTS